jgi:hypothetical protein
LTPAVSGTTATLIITKYTCPPGYNQHAPASDVPVDCTELTDNILFSLTTLGEEESVKQIGITGDPNQGTVQFTGVEPGAYLLTESLPEETGSAFVYTCASDRREFVAENPFVPFAYAGPDGELGIVLVAGETLECDWYDVPEAVVSVLAFDCAGLVINVDACEPSATVSTVTFTSTEQGGEIYTLTTNEAGEAAAAMESGAYAIAVDPGPACLIDSEAFDSEGQLVVEEGVPTEVRVYTCAGS